MGLKKRIQDAVAVMYQRIYDRERSRVKKDARRKPCILFASVSRAEIGGNAEFVYRRICERGLDVDFDIVLDFAPDIKSVETPAKQLAFIKRLARADIIFLDDYHPFVYFVDYPADVKIVQLWHAIGSFKTIGFSRKRANQEEHRRTSRAHRGYTHVIVSAEVDRPHYADAFNTPIDRIFATGIPRVDGFLNKASLVANRQAFFERFPVAQGKRVIVFAPTFREDDIRKATYDFTKLDLEAIAAYCRKANAVFLLKFHQYTHGFDGVPAHLSDVIIKAQGIREVNDLLPAADLLVTDYSSVLYEAALIDVPTVFYPYDLEEYESTRGFYEPYASFVPGPIVKTPEDLVALLSWTGDQEQIDAFKKRHFAHFDSHSSDRVVDLVLETTKGSLAG
ncbi:MAG: CDP-glycerol glycerophosphotransferase family protein [Coriobacteriia bacterium]|nr:CDP-glycerol glycerophosphotransferase family protein [Coriobacteriia bacterium]